MPAVVRVGQVWRRRVERSGDEAEWNSIIVVGVHQITEQVAEYAVRPYPDGLTVVAATASSLESAFTLVSNPDPSPAPKLGTDAIGAWS